MKKIEIGAALRFGWEKVKGNFWLFLGITLVYLVLTSVPSYEQKISENATLIFNILGYLITAWLTAGMLRIGFDVYDGKKPEFKTLFNQLKYFWRLLGAQILISFMVVVGLIFLIVPGIYLALRYQFVSNLIVDKDISIMEAFRQSSEITKGVKLRLLLLNLALTGVIIIGLIALVFGVLIALPVVWLAEIYVYKKLLGSAGTTSVA